MTLTPHQSLMLEAACEEVLSAGRLYRQRRDQPLATEGAKGAALDHYQNSVDYLVKLTKRLKEAHVDDQA